MVKLWVLLKIGKSGFYWSSRFYQEWVGNLTLINITSHALFILEKSTTCSNSIPDYVLVDTSTITCFYITSIEECEMAAIELGINDGNITARNDNDHYYASYDPPGCYYEWGNLYFNGNATNRGPCSTYDVCICSVEAPPPTPAPSATSKWMKRYLNKMIKLSNGPAAENMKS